jgi:DNA-binding response OmpR family regulator
LALFQANRARIELVVIDILSPAAANLDLTAELERLRPGLPVLYLVSERKTIVRCSIEAEAPDSVLVSPFTEEQLMARAERLLEAAPDRQLPDEQLWERLVAASDRISSGTAMLYLYEQQQAPLAAGHMATLRAGKIHHAFRLTNDEAVPYSMVVSATDVTRAQGLIADVSVGRRLIPAA